jgi:hypothetical protein
VSDPTGQNGAGLVFLGGQPHSMCQRCDRYERDARGWCHCAFATCPVGLLIRQRRQRATRPLLMRDAAPRLE